MTSRSLGAAAAAAALLLTSSSAAAATAGAAGSVDDAVRTAADGWQPRGSYRPVAVRPNGKLSPESSLLYSVSPNGRYVTFGSADEKLVKRLVGPEGVHIYVLDRELGSIAMVDVLPSGAPAESDGRHDIAEVTDQGLVLFDSMTDGIVETDRNGRSDVFLRDTKSGVTMLVSVDFEGGSLDGHSTAYDITPDGTKVAFGSTAADVVPGDDKSFGDVFLRDLSLGTTRLVSANQDGGFADRPSGFATVSADGRLVAFDTYAHDIVEGGARGEDVVLRDMATGTSELVSAGLDGSPPDGGSSFPNISADGSTIVFTSEATNLVEGVEDVPKNSEPFAYDVATETISAVIDPFDDGERPEIYNSHVTDDGRTAFFASSAKNLVEGDTNGKADVFAVDLDTFTTRIVTVTKDGQQGEGGSTLWYPGSVHGDYLGLTTGARNLFQRPIRAEAVATVHRLP